MLKKSRFARNIIHIATGSALSQLIMIGSTPVLTRIFDASEFGALALFSACYAFAVGLFTLKYDYAIILPEEDETARQLTALCLALSASLTSVVITGMAAAKFIFHANLAWYFFLVPVASFLGTTYTCAQQWAARRRDYRRASQSQVVNAVLNVGLLLALAAVGTTFSGSLVVSYNVGLGGATIYLLGRDVGRSLSPAHCASLMKAIGARACEYKRFPLFVMPSFLLTTASANTAPFVLRTLFQLNEVGYYAVANRFLLAPSALIGGAVAEAFRAEFVALQKTNGDVERLFLKTLRSLLVVALPIFGILMIFAPFLFGLLLGKNFEQSGQVVKIISLGVLAQFVAQPFQYIFVATGRMRAGLVAQGSMAFFPLLGIFGAGLLGSGMLEALFYGAILSALTSVVMIWMAYRCCAGSNGMLYESRNHA